MIVHCLQIDEGLNLVPFEQEKIGELLDQVDAKVWIDLQDFNQQELEEWLDKLNIQNFSRHLCLELNTQTGFYPLKDEIFMVIPVLNENKAMKENIPVTFLLKENFILTLHSRPVLDSNNISKLLKTSHSWLSGRTTTAIISALMVHVSQDNLNYISALRKIVFDLEERMDRKPDEIEADEIIVIHLDVLRLGAVISNQLPSLQSLSIASESLFELKGEQSYLKCALVNLQAVEKSLNWLDGRVNALNSGFQLYAQEKTNRKLNVLTIIATVFTPMTFLAGIWGMNFESMPELGFQYGYFVALSLMLVVGLGTFVLLKRNE